ncbi:4003_t:CDS:10 [Diversispora eburnea]|uniref:4003_t:CDS:1 n=1 Tax=Diversispora eburnea TaxID=1213867 RepID=A0A9N9BLW9_9GLOM|nr:4003_t:CDS:10 [Diversispora eburnea]
MRSTRNVSYIITHNKDDHGHLLGINSLALDTRTVNPKTGKPEGILYSAGRDEKEPIVTINDLKKRDGGIIQLSDGGIVQLSDGNNSILSKSDDDDNIPLEKFSDTKKGHYYWKIDEANSFSPPRASTFRQSFRSHTDWVNDIILCHNNETLISASSDRTLKLWHPHISNSPTTIGYHSDYIKTLAHAQGPGWIASGGFDRKIILWDIKECRPSSGISSINLDYLSIGTISEVSPKSSIYTLACNPSGSVLVSGSPDKIIRVWDPRSFKQITSFTGHTDNIRAVLVSDDGELVNTTIKLWSLRTQRCINTFTIHSDSVWSLFSDHPRLETFYAGSKDGLVTKTDYSGCAEIRDGDCVAVCKEDAGVIKLVALDNKFVWTATYDSSIKRWKDVCMRRNHKNYMLSSSSTSPPTSPTFPSTSPPSSPPIPSSAVIKLTSNGGVNMDTESATITTTDDHMEDLEDPIPVALIPNYMLNNRRHILTLDNSGEVALWDIILCSRLKTFGKHNIDEVLSKINTIESIPNWCSVDTRVGALTVQLDEKSCFDAEMYADEAGLPEDVEMREDQRKIQRHHNLMQQRLQQSDFRRGGGDQQESRTTLSQKISFPPATLHSTDTSNNSSTIYQKTSIISNSSNNNSGGSNSTPTTPPTAATIQSIINSPGSLPRITQSPTTPVAAFTTGPFTAPATTGTSAQDYFSVNQSPSSSSGTASSIMGRFKNPFNVRSKTPRSPTNTENKQEAENFSSTNNATNIKAGDLKLTVSTNQLKDENNSQPLRKDDETMVNSPTTSFAPQLNQMSVIGGSPSSPSSPSHIPTRQMKSIIVPPFVQFPVQETPEIQIPPHTIIIISEETPEASACVDLYRGTVDSLDRDAEIVEQKAPDWLIEFLIKGRTTQKEPFKIGFLLKPHEGSELDDLPNG